MYYLIAILVAITLWGSLEAITLTLTPFQGMNAISIERRTAVDANTIVSGVQAYQRATGQNPSALADLDAYTGRTDTQAVEPIDGLTWSLATSGSTVHACLSGTVDADALQGLQQFQADTDYDAAFETGCASGSSTTPSAGGTVYLNVEEPS